MQTRARADSRTHTHTPGLCVTHLRASNRCVEDAVFVRVRITRAAALTDDRKRLITRLMAGKSYLRDLQESEAHTPAAHALLFDFSAIAYVRTTVFSFSRLTRHFRSTSARPEHPPWFIYRRARVNHSEMQ
ncbi:hypothetical protein DPX16_2400 [Anabarilius grahami]|uniref:Uncharacterized protein n=1 Tax=Anabarilius grahami TaxID=495550 RepID=A0A3N0Z5D2_ANAGA|nr:hypothetical protein DPX16_2400 [Anabarilius grahami]